MNKKILQLIARYAFITYCFLILVEAIFHSITLLNSPQDKEFCSFNISDWLINYEGGFVRRGFIGQNLLECYNIMPYDIITTIYIITFATTILLFILFFYQFYKHKLSFLLLPTVLMLGCYASTDLTWFRRDALMLLMIFTTLYTYRKYLSSTSPKWLLHILFYLSGIMVILTHEAGFLCFVPFIFIHYLYKDNDKKPLTNRIASATIFLSPLIITFIATCYYKGDATIGLNIWQSWGPYMQQRFGEIQPLGKGIEALNWDMRDTFITHFRLNYTSTPLWDINFMPNNRIVIYKPIMWSIIYIMVYYLCINVNKIRLFKYELTPDNHPINNYLPQVLIIQFISLLPLFTFLSCDLKRIVMYWTLTSFFICFQLLSLKKQLNISFISTTSNSISHFMQHNKVCGNSITFILCVLCIAVPFAGFKASQLFSTSVIGNSLYIINDIIIPNLKAMLS